MNTITTPPTPPSPFKSTPTANHTMTIKIILIALLIIVLIIPILLVHGLISEREERLQSAIEEVHQKWSGSQIVAGPSLTIPYSYQDAEGKWTTRHINCLPEQLEITGTISTKQLQRGIFDIVVYDVPLTIRGRFKASTLSSPSIAPGDLRLADAVLNIGISDLRGIEEQVNVEHNGQVYPVTPGTSPHSVMRSGVSLPTDASPLLKANGELEFTISLHLKGSSNLLFAPLGRTTTVHITSDCPTPSFTGAFLPREREITPEGFTAEWQILELNRNYPQVLDETPQFDSYYPGSTSSLPQDADYTHVSGTILPSIFGVSLLLPVDQYQKSSRATKYAFLVIILTFVICFFTEIIQKRYIHPMQYLLVGLALCLFYTLLIAASEHIGFTAAYLVAALMTTALITLYMGGILKIKRTAFTIGGLLACLYVYIFFLIQLENYALLAGSIGLFVILAIVMYYSQKINWNN